MIKKKWLFFLLITTCFSVKSFCQKRVTLTGIVQDSIKSPLELTNIIIYKNKSANIFTYSITDDTGKFRVEIFKDSLYTLKASFVGFIDWQENINISKNSFKIITLKAASDALNEVTVVYELPIKISGDTISYKVDAFTSGKEKKLKDIIKKLPGFQIDDEGNIKVQGKKVDKIMVDGKEFFSGDTKLATKNIPANVVDKINVLKNFNSVAPLKRLNNQDKYVIDIRLKEGKKNILFGSVEAGLGSKERYISHTNLFYFNPKVSINFIGDINNIGKKALTFQDYFKFNGGFKNAGRKSRSSMNLSSNSLGFSTLQDNKSQGTIAKLGALSYTFNPNKKLSFSGFLIHSEIDYKIFSDALKTYIIGNEDNTELLTSKINQKSDFDIFKLSTTFKPNNKSHLEYTVFTKIIRAKENSLQNSEFQNISNNISADNNNRQSSFQQLLEWYYAKNERNIFSIESSHKYTERKDILDLFLTEQPFESIIPLQVSDEFTVFQNKKITTNNFKTLFNYYYVINKNNHIDFFTGLDMNAQKLISDITQIVDNSEIHFAETDLLNNVFYNYLDVYFGFNYKIKIKKLIINAGALLHIYNLNNRQLNTKIKTEKVLLFPDVRLRYDFKKARTLTLDYTIKAEFTDIENLAKAFIIRNYNSIFSGNEQLNNAWYHQINASYYDFNAYNFSNVYVVLNYQKKYDEISNRLIYNNITNTSSPLNIDKATEILTGYSSYDRRFKNFKIEASTNVSYRLFNNFLEDLLITNKSFTQSYKGAIETTMDNFPILELGFEKVLNNYQSSVFEKQTYTIDKPYASLEVSFFKNFILTANYEYTLYKSNTSNTTSEYDFLNADVYYKKKDSPFEFKISGLNLLNTKFIRNDSFSSNYTSTSKYFVQQRYFVFSLLYEF